MAELDASIPMNVMGGAKPPQAGHGLNPMETVQTVADTLTKLNQVKLFNAEFKARQKAGEILSSAPSFEEGIKLLQADPEIAPFAPKVAQDAMATQNSILESADKDMKLGLDAFHSALGGLSAVAYDPKQMATLKSVALTNAPPQIKARLSKSLDYVENALNSAPDASKRLQLLTGWATAGGWAEAMKAVNGSPVVVNTGGEQRTGVQAPAVGGPLGQAPGAINFTGKIGNTLAPQVTDPKGVVVGGGTSSPAPNALTPSSPPKAAAPTPVPVTTPTSFDSQQSRLGIPLYDANTDKDAPIAVKRNVSGNPAGLEGDRSAALLKKHTEEGREKYEAAQNIQGQLAQVEHDIDTMNANGGWLVSGSAADLRYGLAKLKTTVENMTGTKVNEDMYKVASAENLAKVTHQMAGSLLNNMYGQQREAAETIKAITDKGVPGINNTLMGSKMIISMFKSVADRSQDQYEFNNWWAAKHNGDLRGADEAFNKRFPMKDYINKGLADIGMDEHGFTSREAFDRQVAAGMFTKEQAEAIRQNKGRIPANMPKGPTAPVEKSEEKK